jgi:signal transduction histidine kinase
LEVRRKDGTPWWCHMSAKAMNPASRGRSGSSSTSRFAGEPRRRARRAGARARALRPEDTLRVARFARVSHAAATILSSIEIIDDFGPTLPENERRELIRLVKGAVGRVMGMLDQVELIGRAEADQLEFRPEPQDVEPLVASIAREVEQAQGRRNSVRIVAGGVTARRTLDAKLLFHILGNLVGNALKYSPAGAEVSLDIEADHQAIVFRVADRGMGIPAEDQPRIFESFHRARNVGNVQGTGLGLSIVKQCVELHGGTVTFESKVGLRTTFVIQFAFT